MLTRRSRKGGWQMDSSGHVNGSREGCSGSSKSSSGCLRSPPERRERGLPRLRGLGRGETAGGRRRGQHHGDEGHPVVYAEVGEGPKTLLSYGHYDGSRPNPWTSGRPTLSTDGQGRRPLRPRRGRRQGRRASPHTGVASVYREHGSPPFKLKFLIEGEEEVGSPNLAPFVRSNAASLRRRLLVGGLYEGRGGAAHDLLRHQGDGLRRLRVPRASHDLHSIYAA